MPLPCFTSPSVGLTQTSLAATGLFLKAQQTIINFCTLQSGSPPRTSWHWKDELVQSPRSKTCYQVLFYVTDRDYLRLYRDAIGGGEPAIILYMGFAAPCCRCHSIFPRLGDFFTSGQLVEINSHSLFSKWFSESGKLVQKMFTEIKRLVENPRYCCNMGLTPFHLIILGL